MTHFDIEKLEAKLKGLEEEILSPDFWNNIRAANKKIDEKNDLEYKKSLEEIIISHQVTIFINK